MSGTILDEIVAHKRTEVAARKAALSAGELRELAEQQTPTRGFVDALLTRHHANEPAVIAEVKRASPSKGLIRENFEPATHAVQYERGGAACLSVLTDEKYFQGHDDYLRQARAACQLPVLRKDFVVEEYQVTEARALGADCILLIVAVLDVMSLTLLTQAATNLGLDVLIEVHDKAELDLALNFNPRLIGINNRNLKTFETSIDNTLQLLEHIPAQTMVVTESGIASRDLVASLRARGVNGFLVGESFMRAPDPGVALKELFFT